MKLTIHSDGFDGFAQRAVERAKRWIAENG